MLAPGLYAILDLPHRGGLAPEQVVAALVEGAGAGLAAVQLRAKHAGTGERIAWLERLLPICAAAGVPLFANDDLDAALAVPGVAGVHLGQGDAGFDRLDEVRARAAAGFAVGISTHSLPQLRAALAQRPDYVAFGPVFSTTSKRDADPTVGLEGLADAGRIAARPLVAIGGLDVERAAQAVAVGADRIAVIGGLVATTAEEISSRARAYVAAITEAARWWSIDEVHAAIPVLSKPTLEGLARWGDDLGVLAQMRLPARFSPRFEGGCAQFRARDVCDLQWALGKHAGESWAQWTARGDTDGSATLVQLRSLDRARS